MCAAALLILQLLAALFLGSFLLRPLLFRRGLLLGALLFLLRSQPFLRKTLLLPLLFQRRGISLLGQHLVGGEIIRRVVVLLHAVMQHGLHARHRLGRTHEALRADDLRALHDGRHALFI